MTLSAATATKMGAREQSRFIAKQKADGVTHCLLFLFPDFYRRRYLPTSSWIDSSVLRDRRVYATAVTTRAAPITIPKIASIVMGFSLCAG